MSLVVRNVNKSFGDPPNQILKKINLEIKKGDLVSLTGKSGSGKSTLLYIISSLDKPTSGNVLVEGKDLHALNEKDIHEFRNLHMGFVFQFHYLLPELNTIENVLMPARKTLQEIQLEQRALSLLKEFGLSGKENKKPSQLSGGEQQRVSIARALIMKPSYLFADEPTGNLDSINARIIMDLFVKINNEYKTTIIYVTHDEDFSKIAKRKIVLVDGEIQ
ncbi:MAG: ABC transporter ATP-binding protein [Leptospiraceae bacterium]|nr:ABC transporter ATP-binding protein [Leptospiraceae bacterium]